MKGVVWLEDDQVKRLGRKDGLPCELVTTLLEGADGNLWMGTEGGGVCRYDGDVLQVIQFSDEPVYNVVNALCQDRLGRVWIGTRGD